MRVTFLNKFFIISNHTTHANALLSSRATRSRVQAIVPVLGHQAPAAVGPTAVSKSCFQLPKSSVAPQQLILISVSDLKLKL